MKRCVLSFLMNWEEWLYQYLKYVQFSVSCQWLLLNAMNEWFYSTIYVGNNYWSQKYSLNFRITITMEAILGTILTTIKLLSILCRMFYGYKVLNVMRHYFTDHRPWAPPLSLCSSFIFFGWRGEREGNLGRNINPQSWNLIQRKSILCGAFLQGMIFWSTSNPQGN